MTLAWGGGNQMRSFASCSACFLLEHPIGYAEETDLGLAEFSVLSRGPLLVFWLVMIIRMPLDAVSCLAHSREGLFPFRTLPVGFPLRIWLATWGGWWA